MTEIRHELLRLLILNYAEQWVPEHIAYVQLARYGDRLIPGLIECLDDYDSEVRHLAVNLLDEAGLSAAPALPALIQAVAADPDRRRTDATRHTSMMPSRSKSATRCRRGIRSRHGPQRRADDGSGGCGGTSSRPPCARKDLSAR